MAKILKASMAIYKVTSSSRWKRICLVVLLNCTPATKKQKIRVNDSNSEDKREGGREVGE
jgi:hypothetical protein